MLLLLSPSKKLDESTPVPQTALTRPVFEASVNELVQLMAQKKPQDIAAMMELSDKLAQENYARYQNFTRLSERPALFLFKGDVYDNMDVARYTPADLDFAQQHIRILSGLYGVLRPLDAMKPYRLEMGRKLKTAAGSTLYDFWGERITEQLNQVEDDVVINLASQEYFAAVKSKKLNKRRVDVVFKQQKNGKLKTIGLMAKRARGQMADFIVRERIKKPQDLKEFSRLGYVFQPDKSDVHTLTFTLNMDAA